jgi:hypothetical protein
MVTDRSSEAEPTPPQGSDYSDNASGPDEGTVNTEHPKHDSAPHPTDQTEPDEETANSGRPMGHFTKHPKDFVGGAKGFLGDVGNKLGERATQVEISFEVLTQMTEAALPPNWKQPFHMIWKAGELYGSRGAICDLGVTAVKGAEATAAHLVGLAETAAAHLDGLAETAAAHLDNASDGNRDSARATMEAMGRDLPANVGLDHVMQAGAERDEYFKTSAHQGLVDQARSESKWANNAFGVQLRQWQKPPQHFRPRYR